MYSLGIHVPASGDDDGNPFENSCHYCRMCDWNRALDWTGIKQFDKAQSCKQIGSWMDLYHWNICCGGKLYIFAVIFEERVREKI